MKMNKFKWAALALAFSVSAANAGVIKNNDIVAIPDPVGVGSGNGNLDLLLFTQGSNDNVSGGFDGDDSNTEIAQGGGDDLNTFSESYITSGAKLKAYYDLNFGSGNVNEMVLFLDLNETGEGLDFNFFTKIDIILNPTAVQGSPDPLTTDVQTSEQNGIDQTFTGGSVLASMETNPSKNLPGGAQGGGFADWFVLTGVNPYDFADGDEVLFNVSMSRLSNGAEAIFLSGLYQNTDLPPSVPLPGAVWLFGTGLLGLLGVAKRKKA